MLTILNAGYWLNFRAKSAHSDKQLSTLWETWGTDWRNGSDGPKCAHS